MKEKCHPAIELSRVEMRDIISIFRVLKGWKVSLVPAGKHEARTWISSKKKRAIIYNFRGQAPKDFILHEVLHIVLATLESLDKRSPKIVAENDEIIVQDLCYLYGSSRHSAR